jgi:hypothetical protein
VTGPDRHVVMLVADDALRDQRARGHALALAQFGLRVTVLGVTTEPRRWDTLLSAGQPSAAQQAGQPQPVPDQGATAVRIVRVPVDFVLRDHRERRRARWQHGELGWLAPDRDSETLARRRLAVAGWRAQGTGGPAGVLLRQGVVARRFALRACGAGRRRASRVTALGFDAWDGRRQRLPLVASPHRVAPELDDLELAVGPVLDDLLPTVIHVQDVHLMEVAARAVGRAHGAGRQVRWLYDAREWVPGLAPQGERTRRVMAAWARLERRQLRAADRVLASSPASAAALQSRHRLSRPPAVLPDQPAAGLLADVYRDLLGAPRLSLSGGARSGGARSGGAPGAGSAAQPVERLVRGRLPAGVVLPGVDPSRGDPPPQQVFLAIGPANSAGQAWAWARAAERHLDGVRARVVAIRNGRYDYPADELVEAERYRSDPGWQLRQLADARSRWTHVLLEAGRPILGALTGRDFVGDAQLLTQAGVRVGLALHGSELRSPRRHAAGHEFSPFSDPGEALTRRLQTKVDTLAPAVARFAAAGGPVFVSTPDQLDDVPAATWLPVVVDLARWPAPGDTLRRGRPLFVHAPSNPRLKGTAEVERVLRPLAERGLIEFQLLTGLAPERAAELIAAADVVVDQLLLGLYGMLACEAMATGRLVLGHLGAALRGRVDVLVPVVEVTPATLAQVVERVLDDRQWARESAAQGPAFVTSVHDGRRSAGVLAAFLRRDHPDRGTTGGSSWPGRASLEVPGP